MAPTSVAMSKPDISSLLDKIALAGNSYLSADSDCNARIQLCQLTSQLSRELADPQSDLLWIAWAEPTRSAAIRVAIDIDLFSALDTASTVQQLAAATSTSPSLLRRLLRHLAATEVLLEIAPDEFAATAFSNLLQDPRHAAALTYSAAVPARILSELPAFLREMQYVDPNDQRHAPFQRTMGTELSPWDWARGKDELATTFALHMSGRREGLICWTDKGFYPLIDRLVKGSRADPEDIFLVDVGGGLGDDLKKLKTQFPDAMKGKRLLLQELEMTAKAAGGLYPWMEVQVHNFFHQQPVKGKTESLENRGL